MKLGNHKIHNVIGSLLTSQVWRKIACSAQVVGRQSFNVSNYLPKNLIIILSSIFCILAISCEDFVEIDAPRTETVRETVFSSDETANAAMDGVYSIIIPPFSLFGGNLEIITGLLSDELNTNGNDLPYIEYASNDVQPDNSDVIGAFWSDPYMAIYNANGIIEGLMDNNQVRPDLRDHLKGEALFMRALLHFYLVNFYGAIPYVESTDIEVNNSLSREQSAQVYPKIIRDLLEAEQLMFEDYEVSDGERVRANRYAATALLAKVYLYTEDWSNAEAVASNVINETSLYNMEMLDNVFSSASQESILQVASLSLFNNSNISPLGDFFVIVRPPTGLLGLASLDPNFITLFDPSDARRSSWIGMFTSGATTWYYSNKYKNHQFNEVGPPENTLILRLGEQFLIRAEARARQGNITGAVEDIDVIRARAGATLLTDSIPNISQTQLLEFIEQERQRELFVEGGHRWLDLKRTGRADEVLSVVKPTWEPTDVLLPIPEAELRRNANLLPQNLGY